MIDTGCDSTKPPVYMCPICGEKSADCSAVLSHLISSHPHYRDPLEPIEGYPNSSHTAEVFLCTTASVSTHFQQTRYIVKYYILPNSIEIIDCYGSFLAVMISMKTKECSNETVIMKFDGSVQQKKKILQLQRNEPQKFSVTFGNASLVTTIRYSKNSSDIVVVFIH